MRGGWKKKQCRPRVAEEGRVAGERESGGRKSGGVNEMEARGEPRGTATRREIRGHADEGGSRMRTTALRSLRYLPYLGRLWQGQLGKGDKIVTRRAECSQIYCSYTYIQPQQRAVVSR